MYLSSERDWNCRSSDAKSIVRDEGIELRRILIEANCAGLKLTNKLFTLKLACFVKGDKTRDDQKRFSFFGTGYNLLVKLILGEHFHCIFATLGRNYFISRHSGL